jgi:predicted DNA-binding transcriptional regulator YafY
MPSENSTRQKGSVETWLPPLLLKFLVFLVFACVVAGAMVGVLRGDLTANRLWLIIGGMVALLLLLGVDRLIALRVGPEGVEAELTQAQEQALARVQALEDPKVAEAARAQILQAKTPAEVHGAVGMAMELNVSRVVDRVKAAIRARRKLYVHYQAEPGGDVDIILVAPLDIKPGKTARTRSQDYLWVHSYEDDSTHSLRLDRVVGVDVGDETFDPADIMADWKEKVPVWNVEREW